jgi:hypothetical protein
MKKYTLLYDRLICAGVGEYWGPDLEEKKAQVNVLHEGRQGSSKRILSGKITL